MADWKVVFWLVVFCMSPGRKNKPQRAEKGGSLSLCAGVSLSVSLIASYEHVNHLYPELNRCLCLGPDWIYNPRSNLAMSVQVTSEGLSHHLGSRTRPVCIQIIFSVTEVFLKSDLLWTCSVLWHHHGSMWLSAEGNSRSFSQLLPLGNLFFSWRCWGFKLELLQAKQVLCCWAKNSSVIITTWGKLHQMQFFLPRNC